LNVFVALYSLEWNRIQRVIGANDNIQIKPSYKIKKTWYVFIQYLTLKFLYDINVFVKYLKLYIVYFAHSGLQINELTNAQTPV